MSKKDDGITRRQFFKDAAIAGAAVASTSMLGIASAEASPVPTPKKWNKETDVVIVGFGAAGSAAAIAAAGGKAKVLILEKMPEATAGGASSCFGGIFTIKSAKYMLDNSMGTMAPETAKAIEAEEHRQFEWMKKQGVKMRTDYPYLIEGGSKFFYKFLKEQVTKTPGVSVMYNTPVKALVQDCQTREIRGVVAEQNGKKIYVKAKKAVIIVTGAYNANTRLVSQLHVPCLKVATVDSPANTGEGLLMGLAAGAALDNMGTGLDWFEFAFRIPSEKYGTGISHRIWSTPDLIKGSDGSKLNNSRIFVNMAGQRFMNEKTVLTHEKSNPIPFLAFNAGYGKKNKGWANVPMFLVCDDTEIKSGPLGKVPTDNEWEWAKSHGVYNWSDDNSAEIKAGWLIKADTLDELAAKMTAIDYAPGEALRTMDAAALKATVSQYNAICASGNDPLGRPAKTLKPIVNPPFYAVELMPCLVYSTGGLRYNINAQTLDNNDKPIPRLYSAGDVGQGVALAPNGIPGVLACGAIAGRHAATLSIWK